jgi:predicted HicB family RNase H-like nuclease
MKKLVLGLVLSLLMVSAVSANPFSDVPFSHWAYDAVNKLAAKGILAGYPDGTFKGRKAVTRYALAMVTAKMLANVEQMLESGIGTNLVTKADLATLEKLTVEFADELALLGVKVTALEDDMEIVKEDVSMLKRDVEGIKDYMAKGGMEKVKLSGDMMVRHSNIIHKHDWVTNPLAPAGFQGRAGNSNNSLTESQIRLRFTANIDENIKAVARWRMFVDNPDNVNAAQSARQGAYGRNGIGGLTVTDGIVDTAFLQIKDMFRFGGDFIFGRKYQFLGHRMLINNFMDVVRYDKRSGDVDVTFMSIYDRHQGNFGDSPAGVDFRNVWNLDLKTNYKDHNLYLDFYAQDDPALWNDGRFNNPFTGINIMTGAAAAPLAFSATGVQTAANAGFVDGDKRWDIEFGSKGPIGDCGHWSYDLGFVYTNYELDVVNLNPAQNWKQPEMQGWMGHGAINWDSKKEWAAKLAYTFADDEAVGAYAITNDARYCDAPETPYEDVGRGNAYFNNGLMNMYDIKLQAEYRPRDSKHYFRLAADWLDEMNDTVSNDLARYAQGRGDLTANPAIVAPGSTKANTAYDKWNNFMIDDAEAMVITFEYRYQLTENTRLRVGYMNFDFTGDAQKAGWTNGVANAAQPTISAGRGLMNDYDYNYFWAEIFSRF